MWTPDPTWQRLSDAGDGSRLWRRDEPGRGAWVGKRLLRPRLGEHADHGDTALTPADRAALDPHHVLWWRREADVVEQRWAESLPGLRGPGGGRVEEDDDGVTVWWPLVERLPADDLAVAAALGGLASAPAPQTSWACHDPLADRWRGVEAAGGWSTIGETPAADVAAALWSRRAELLAALAVMPQVTVHGDVVPGNVLGTAPVAHAHVVACDWSATGRGPAGTDLGFFTLSTRSRLAPLLDAYLGAADELGVRLDADAVTLAARVQMAFTVLTRADRVLGRIAGGEGDWHTKLRHPAVAPAMRALQRAYPDFAPLLD